MSTTENKPGSQKKLIFLIHSERGQFFFVKVATFFPLTTYIVDKDQTLCDNFSICDRFLSSSPFYTSWYFILIYTNYICNYSISSYESEQSEILAIK